MSASEELERGRLAAEVLENPVYRDAMDQLRAEIVTRWQNEKNEADRNWLWALTQASKRLDQVLQDTMATGQLRSKQIELQRTRAEKAGQTLRRVFAG
jgi:hypothetical protein